MRKASMKHTRTLAVKLDATDRTDQTKTVSSLSQWSDPVWRFPSTTAGIKTIALHWKFEMPDGSFSDEPQWHKVIEQARRFLYSYRYQNQRGKNPKNGTLPHVFSRLRYLIRWMAEEKYNNFSQIDKIGANDYLARIYRDKCADDNEEIGFGSFSRYADILCLLYEQSSLFFETPEMVLPCHPYGGRASHDVASDYVKQVMLSIPPVPDEVFLQIVPAALDWLEAPARDTIRLTEIYTQVRSRTESKVEPSRGARPGVNEALSSYIFNDDDALTSPWRSPIISPTDEMREVERAENSADLPSATYQLRSLIMKTRDACTIVIQSLLGLRISEVAGLQSAPVKPETGWPACIDIRPSRTGLNEVFYVTGRLFKERDTWQNVEWVAGIRPFGTDYLPPPVEAILILHKLYAPWRELTGRSDLILNLGKNAGLTFDPDLIGGVLSNSLRIGQKAFVEHHVKLPDTFRDWNLTTHQWRKSFALYVVRSDERLLPAVSDHFKHVSLAITEQGYLGSDPGLLGAIDDMASREAARLLFEAVTGKTVIAGKMADIVEENAKTIEACLGGSGSDDEKIGRLDEEIVGDDLRVWPAPWGKCLFRSETARCHYLAHNNFDLAARRPEYAHRQSSVCCECSNLIVVPDVHANFWRNRHSESARLYSENRAAGEEAAASVAKSRMRLAEAILRKMNIVVDFKYTDE